MHFHEKRLLGCLLVGLSLSGCGGRAAKAPATPVAENRAPLGDAPPPPPDLAKVEAAMAAMDRGDLMRAIRTLEDVRTRHPDNGVVVYELALAYRLANKPREAASVLAPFRPRLNARGFANLGSALDELGKSAEAMAVFHEGLKRFPNSGLLHAELGTALANQHKFDEALDSYQRGMTVEPDEPASYIRLSLLLAHTDYRGLSLIFGETFRLLEPASERSFEIARMMTDICRTSVKTETLDNGQFGATVSLAPTVEVKSAKEIADLPLVNVFELTFGPPLAHAHREGLSLASLHKARVEFVNVMNRPDSPFDWDTVPIFHFIREADKNGMLEVYDYWLFGPGFPEEFGVWANANRSSAETLGRYVNEHPLFVPDTKPRP
jgi:tetratricopeptide (TPR) repeat protein